MGTRRKAREAALQMLFQWEAGKDDPARVKASYWEGLKADDATRDFANQLFEGTVAALAEIDPLLCAHSQHWRLERMAAVDRNLLRLAVYELQAYPQTPRPVIINEALEIARKYSGPDSVEFVNGVLDSIRRTLAMRTTSQQ